MAGTSPLGRVGEGHDDCHHVSRPSTPKSHRARRPPFQPSRSVPPSSMAEYAGIAMTELVAYYEREPIEIKGDVEIRQFPISEAEGLRSTEGFARTSLVYVMVTSETGRLLVPFGTYDDWSLRDRYNEALRIMNSLGAAEIWCETFRERSKRRGLRGRIATLMEGGNGAVEQEKLESSDFNFKHVGIGRPAQDPRPLRWAHEPGFEAAVESVLDNGSTSVTINIRSDRTHSINGSLGTKLKGFGFDLGGTTSHSDATSLHIHATFPQAKRSRW